MTASTTAPSRIHDSAWAQPASHRLAYIDGVRAIAILAVIAFHARIPGFGGGFVGVDVFFVISGFLITSQIVSQLLAGRFSLYDFYARRILRIFPPLLLVTVVTVVLALAFPVLPQEGKNLAKTAAATAAMISNYYFPSGTQYFALITAISPLLHTWSLSVEEQYYLLTPGFMLLIAAIAMRRNWDVRRALIAGGVLAIVVSYVALVVLTDTDRRVAFFSLVTRMWQFAIGGLLAMAMLKGTPVPERWRSWLGVIGVAAILAAVHFYDDHMPYPGKLAGLLPTLGAALVLASGIGNEGGPLTRTLASRPAVVIGLLSYSWYLWHWPLTELARTLPVGQDTLWKDVAATSTALLLSIPTYLFLERPLKTLRRPEITRRYGGRIVAGGVAGSALIALAMLAAGQSKMFDRSLQAIPVGIPERGNIKCRPSPDQAKFVQSNPCVVGVDGAPSVVFFGDSHSLMLEPIADWSARDAGRAAVVFGKPVCPPLVGVEIEQYRRHTCVTANTEIVNWALAQQNPRIGGFVLSARWSIYDEDETPAREAFLPRLIWGDRSRRNGNFEAMVTASLTDMLAKLAPQHRVLVVGPTPDLRGPPEHCLMRAQLSGRPPEFCQFSRADAEKRHARAMAVLKQVVAKFPGVRLLDPLDAFCDRETCRPFGPRGVYYIDHDHVSSLGAEVLYRAYAREFQWVYGAN